MTLHIDSSTLDRLVRALERRSTRFWAGCAVGTTLSGVAVATGLGALTGGRGWAIALSVSLFFAFFSLALAGIAAERSGAGTARSAAASVRIVGHCDRNRA